MTVDRNDEPTAMQRQREGGEEGPRCRAPPGGGRDIGGRGSTRDARRHRSQGGGLGELSQMQQHRLGSEAHDGDGGDVGETAARVATVTMKLKVA